MAYRDSHGQRKRIHGRRSDHVLRNDYGIVHKPITTRNPQANVMVERAHATLHEMVRAIQIKDKRDFKRCFI